MAKIIILIGCFLLWQEPNIVLVDTEITEEITIGLPEGFGPMTDFEKQQRIISYREPLGLFTDPESQVDLGINTSISTWQSSDLDLLSNFLKSSLIDMFTSVDFIDEGVREINGRDFVFFEFKSTVESSSSTHLRPITKYTLIYYTLNSGQTLLFNFTCPQALQGKWRQTAHKVMESIQIGKRDG